MHSMLNFFLNAKLHHLLDRQMEWPIGVKSQPKGIDRAGSGIAENDPKRP